MAGVQRSSRPSRAEVRERLLDAAGRVLAARGFHATRVEAVCEEAGFSTGALYSNFAGKDDLFLALYEERIERRARELREAFRGAGSDAAGVAAAAQDVRRSLREDREFFLLYFEFALHAARDKTFARRFRSVRAEGLAELEAGLAAGLARAGVEADASQLAHILRALSFGLALDRLVGDDSPDDLVVRALALVLAGAGAEQSS